MKSFLNKQTKEIAITLSYFELLRINNALCSECIALNDEYDKLLEEEKNIVDVKDEMDLNRSWYILTCKLRDTFIKLQLSLNEHK